MAAKKGWPEGEPGRVPGLLLAEVALVAVLVIGLDLSWPANPQPVQPPAVPMIASRTVAVPPVTAGPFEDDQAPPRPSRLSRIPFFPPPPPPPAVPVQLLVASLNLHPVVESVGVDRFGAMSPPYKYFNVGWYNLGPIPGDPGDAVIDGHAGYPDQPLVFGRLGTVKLGAQLVVVMADRSRRTFTVKSVKSWPWSAHPAGLFQGDGPARLTLITCSGAFNDKTHAYAERLVVEATYNGPA